MAKNSFDWGAYAAATTEFYDEMFTAAGKARKESDLLYKHIKSMRDKDLAEGQNEINAMVEALGISFSVYRDGVGQDRAWPLDLIPRVIDGATWDKVAAGLQQRLRAINLFIQDVYSDEKAIKDGVVPENLIKKSPNYRPQCVGVTPPLGVWAHICGTDLVRDADGQFYVLEDNLRIPSGVSYMLENREVMFRVAPNLFDSAASGFEIRPIADYVSSLGKAFSDLSPQQRQDPVVVVFTPGHYNSAYFEHVYLAQQLGAQLAQARDMVVIDDTVYLRTISGLSPVDVIYRRIDDWFMDPEAMNPESLLGVPGLVGAWRKGNVCLVNAPGCGVADDKVVCTYIPDIIRYYTGEEPILPNVPTWRLSDKQARDEALTNMKDNVFKPANEAGGLGVIVGKTASQKTLNAVKKKILANPRNYVAQPLIKLSVSPTVCSKKIEARHLDLRPFTVQAGNTFTTAGGLTRVARKRGSYIVNSSQGGGSKDTWIVDAARKRQ